MKVQQGNAYGRVVFRKSTKDATDEPAQTRSPLGQTTKGGPIEIRYFSDVAKLLVAGVEISDPSVWQQMAIVCSRNFEEMSAHQSPLSGVRALAMCADQHVKAKILQLKGASGGAKGLDELRRQIESAISAPELNPAQADEGWDRE